MAEVKDKPEGMKTTNALDDVHDPDANALQPQELKLGTTTLMVMDKPPKTGDYVDVAMRLRIKRTAEDQNTTDSPLTYPRYGEIVAAWPLGQEMPEPKKSKKQEDAEAEAEAAKNQPPLYDDESDVQDQDDGDDDDA